MKTDPTIPTQRPPTPDSASGCPGPGYPHFPPHCGCPTG